MDWKNAIKDESPVDRQTVLVAIDGIYYNATYSATGNGFQIHKNEKFIPVKNNSSLIYWVEMEKN